MPKKTDEMAEQIILHIFVFLWDALKTFIRREDKIMATLEELKAQLQNTDLAIDSIATNLGAIPALITTETEEIKQAIADAQAGTVDLTEVSEIVGASATKLSTIADVVNQLSVSIAGISESASGESV